MSKVRGAAAVVLHRFAEVVAQSRRLSSASSFYQLPRSNSFTFDDSKVDDECGKILLNTCHNFQCHLRIRSTGRASACLSL
eukprot:s6081_g3.t1